ncbi:bifunctional diguanylate cyclase/phosphodiesterase [Marinomonas pollencensis]|uniref:cyclic-guanylate-specific phosphodiesterase n=1 Tax=Marinomonas pollencensis TaxID=491954 RepID=A0A3E0DY06_9GAMM|nr:EAL domain-containing protein [Marinomonas pollencensis]REG86971.1 periplasmic sensor diguanylate cyclase/phosphodiesterase [Marinomonas pollencensis]
MLIKTELKQHFAILIAGIIFIAVVLFGLYWTYSSNQTIIKEQQLLLDGLSRTQASTIERRLSLAFTSTQLLAIEIEHHNDDFDGADDFDDFDEYSKHLMSFIEGISSLQLAPNGIIQRIFPLEGNEAAIGLDIFANSKYREAALQAIEEHKMIAIGPVSLVQGGTAVIGRSPVYLYRGTQREVFWGFASAIINLNDLLEPTRLKELEADGYQYNLTRKHLDTGKSLVFAQSEKPLSTPLATAQIHLPIGVWQINMSRDIHTRLESNFFAGAMLTLIVALLITIGFYAILIQPLRLSTLVREKTEELQRLAYNDPLTKLPNRRYLNDQLPALLKRNKKRRQISAFIYFDLDNFKRINDTIGHDVGDQVLEIVAQRLDSLCKDDDKVVRLGGDEFGIFLSNIANKQAAKEHAERILAYIHSPISLDTREFFLSTSLGIAMIPEHGNTLVSIMQNADMALYQAKQRGKNQSVFYSHDMKTTALDLVEAEEDLTKALQNNEFELYYQPQFDLNTKQIFGAEALIRWNHPTKGLIFPDQFIQLAENTGQIIKIGHWVLENGISYLARRREQGLPYILLHVNLSSQQLSDPNLATIVKALLYKYQVPAKWLGVEVTETSLLEDVSLAKALLQTLKDMGMCIAIDDFGTGYSSLGQLKNLPVNLLKVDRSFVMDLERDKADRKIVEAIIAMAHKLGIKVLAEGIETKEQWEMLTGFQCDFGQGYYVSRAVPEKDFNQAPPLY